MGWYIARDNTLKTNQLGLFLFCLLFEWQNACISGKVREEKNDRLFL